METTRKDWGLKGRLRIFFFFFFNFVMVVDPHAVVRVPSPGFPQSSILNLKYFLKNFSLFHKIVNVLCG